MTWGHAMSTTELLCSTKYPALPPRNTVGPHRNRTLHPDASWHHPVSARSLNRRTGLYSLGNILCSSTYLHAMASKPARLRV